MDAWVLWLIAAVVLAVAEVVNTSFYLFPFSIGTGGAALVALAGAGTPIAIVVFAVLTALSFGIVRPIARRHLSAPPTRSAPRRSSSSPAGRSAPASRSSRGRRGRTPGRSRSRRCARAASAAPT